MWIFPTHIIFLLYNIIFYKFFYKSILKFYLPQIPLNESQTILSILLHSIMSKWIEHPEGYGRKMNVYEEILVVISFCAQTSSKWIWWGRISVLFGLRLTVFGFLSSCFMIVMFNDASVTIRFHVVK